MEYLTIVNRSSKTLKGTWDGRHYDIAPGKHSFPVIQAEKFKEQNPVMGTDNPYSAMSTKQYLIGIVEYNDDITPIEQTDAIELWDRSKMPNNDVRVIRGNGMYSPRMDSSASAFNAGGPVETGFAKP